jgi:hypothetical protein
LARIQRNADAVQLVQQAAQALHDAAAEAAMLPSREFGDFLNGVVPDTRHIEADAERIASALT